MVVLMAKESDITSIRIPKSVKAELEDVAFEKEPMHVTIQRLIRDNKHLKKENERYDNIINAMLEKTGYKEDKTDLMLKTITAFCNKGYDEFGAYMSINKIAGDITLSESERIDALVNNDFLTELLNDGKDEIVLKASKLVKEQTEILDVKFHNQIFIVDEFLKYIGLQ